MAEALVEAGLSANFASTLRRDDARVQRGARPVACEGRTPANTTPTRFEDFAGELAAAYQAM